MVFNVKLVPLDNLQFCSHESLMEMGDSECLALRAILLRELMSEGKFAGFMWIVALALHYLQNSALLLW